MDPVTIKNDKEYPVEVTYKEGEEEKTVTVEAGAEIQVPEDQKEAVETAISEAEAPEEEETEEEKAAREQREQEEADAEAAKSEEDKKKDAELARIKAENAEYRKQAVDAEYDRLLKEGKIVPAQEKAFKALASASDSSVQFSNGKKTEDKPVSKLISELFAAATKVIKFSEDGGNGGEGGEGGAGEGDTPYDKLSEEAKAGLQATNVTKERYNENVAKHPEMYPEHNQDNKKDEE